MKAPNSLSKWLNELKALFGLKRKFTIRHFHNQKLVSEEVIFLEKGEIIWDGESLKPNLKNEQVKQRIRDQIKRADTVYKSQKQAACKD